MIEIFKEFASKKIDLLKMEATEKTSMTVGTITFFSVIAVAFLFFIILFNIGIGLLIGYWLDNYAYGVLIVAAFYLLIIIIMFIARKSVTNFVADKIVKLINS